MIKIVEGDLLQAKEYIIAHQVNCQGAFGSGVARAIRNQHPKAYEDYTSFSRTRSPEELLGKCLITVIDEGKAIAHLYGQLTYGRDNSRYTSYDALANALKAVYTEAKETDSAVAMPYGIGCGLGGAEWNIVYTMIETIFHDVPVTLYRL